MARKKFHFDFDEEAEPVDELHRYRVALMEHFKTLEAVMEYIDSAPTAEEFLAKLDAEEEKKRRKTVGRRKAATAAKSRGKRKSAGQTVHA
jgi:hypothetical protein